MEPLRIGPEFAGYRIERRIGRGTLGEVYVGIHPRLRMEHALKILHPDLTKDSEFSDRFLRQTRITARLSHPNIAPLFDSGEERGFLYVIMPFIRGTDLRRTLDRTEGPSVAETLSLLGQAASALDAAHSEDLVHRALKPENVLVQLREGQGPRVHLVDFGMTRRTGGDPLTRLQEGMSTLTYMAPEQINRPDLDGRADVYSLGCILYECLTGRPPFRRDTEGALLYAHLVEPPPRVTDLRRDLPEGIDQIVLRAMEKDRGRRFSSCRALLGEATLVLGALAHEEEREAAGRLEPGSGAQVRTAPSPAGTEPHDHAIPLPPPFPPLLPVAPERKPLFRLLLWAAAALVLWAAIIGGALGLSATTGHRYPRSAIENFMKGCTSQASVSVCGCEISRVQERFSLQEFQSLLQRFSRSRDLPGELEAIARECGDVPAAGPRA